MSWFSPKKDNPTPPPDVPKDGNSVLALRWRNGQLEMFRGYSGRFGADPDHGWGKWEVVPTSSDSP